jgi:transcriptional regulator with XRE-family HTH domain
MTINPILKTIRTKKLGVLMRDARLASGKSLEECAQAIGVPSATLEAYEYGERPPSLPELEMFAYFLQIPLEHFWGSETLKKDGRFAQKINPEQVKGLRQRVIGALIRKTRLEAGLSEDALAEEAGLSAERLVSYELGEASVPLPELESLAQVLNASIRDFQDRHGPAGAWFLQQRALQDFSDLPPELQAFVCKPVNRPYLELAQRLSEMQVEKLRAVAEGLLEITL